MESKDHWARLVRVEDQLKRLLTMQEAMGEKIDAILKGQPKGPPSEYYGATFQPDPWEPLG